MIPPKQTLALSIKSMDLTDDEACLDHRPRRLAKTKPRFPFYLTFSGSELDLRQVKSIFNIFDTGLGIRS